MTALVLYPVTTDVTSNKLSTNIHNLFSDKSKRRTKTVKKSLEPRWNQTFLYSHVHRRDFRERMLEITVWDQPRAQEEESDFLGEVGLQYIMMGNLLLVKITHHLRLFAFGIL